MHVLCSQVKQVMGSRTFYSENSYLWASDFISVIRLELVDVMGKCCSVCVSDTTKDSSGDQRKSAQQTTNSQHRQQMVDSYKASKPSEKYHLSICNLHISPPPPTPPRRAYHGHLTLPFPGSREFDFGTAVGVGNLTTTRRRWGIWLFVHNERRENVERFSRQDIAFHDRMADRKWAVETQGRF